MLIKYMGMADYREFYAGDTLNGAAPATPVNITFSRDVGTDPSDHIIDTTNAAYSGVNSTWWTALLKDSNFINVTGDVTYPTGLWDSTFGFLELPLITPDGNIAADMYGAPLGVATLDATGNVPISELGNVVSGTGPASGDLSGTYPSPSVAKVNGVAISSAVATILAQMGGAVARTASAAVAAGEQTIVTGASTGLTMTLPGSAGQTSTVNTILNLNANNVTFAPGTGTTLNYMGTVGNITVATKTAYQAVLVGTVWYVIDANFITAGGDLTGTYPSPTLISVGPGVTGPIGASTTIPIISIDAKGRVTALTSTGIGSTTPNGAAGGDLTGTYPNPTLATAGPGATGPIGDGTHVATITIDAKGRVTALTSTAITSGGSGTVTTVSVASANGFAGTVATATSTPAITISTTVTGLLKGNGTAISAATAGTDYLVPAGSGAALTGITNSQVSGSAPLASPTFTGTPAAPTATAGTSTTQIATTAFVAVSYAPLASPALTGTPTAPTQTALDNSTRIATTAYVDALRTAVQTLTNKTLTAPAVTSLAGTETNVTPINNAVTVTTNAGTVPVTSKLSTFTNSSAAAMTITIATTSAVDGQPLILRIYDFSAVAQNLTFVNCESSSATLPTRSNGSTTLPLTVAFMYNAATSKFRCVAVA